MAELGPLTEPPIPASRDLARMATGEHRAPPAPSGATAARPHASGLAPKLRRPAVTSRTIHRSDVQPPTPLATALERDCGTVAFVAGSAGTGKTTLLATWADALVREGHSVGWASLDADDNDPAALARTLLDAVLSARGDDETSTTTSVADGDDAVGDAVGGDASGPTPRSLLLRIVARAGADPRPVWLLVDDVHVLHDRESVGVLERLLRWAPATLNVVMASRTEPNVHLAKLRLDERLVEVRERQLRFNRRETAELVRLHGLALDDDQIDRLHELAEGWPAGVALAAVSMANGRAPAAFLADLAQNDRAISSYLVEEVLATMPVATRAFLEMTSVLDEVSPGVAAAVARRPGAGSLLRSLSLDNAMVTRTPRGAGGVEVFHYHALLRSHLLLLLASRGPRRPQEAHRRAARWYLDAGVPLKALDHARQAGDVTLARKVIRDGSLHLLAEGQAPSLRRALDELGVDDDFAVRVGAVASGDLADTVRARRALGATVTQGSSALPVPTPGDLSTATPPVDVDPDRRLEDLTRLGLRILDLISGRHADAPTPPRARPALDGAIAAPPAGSREPALPIPADLDHEGTDLAMLEGLARGGQFLSEGRFPDARTAYETVLQAAERTSHELMALQAMSGLATACSGAEDVAGMRRWSEAVLRRSAGSVWHESPRLLPAFVLSAWASFARVDDHEAGARNAVARRVHRVAMEGLPVASGPEPDSALRRGLDQLGRMARLLEAYLEVSVADPQPGARQAASRRVLESARTGVGQSLSAPLAAGELMIAHQLQLRAGLPQAAEEIEELAVGLVPRERHRVMTALRALHTGDAEAARADATEATRAPALSSSPRAFVVAHLVLAVLAHENRQPGVAHEELALAVDVAAPGGSVRTVVEVPGVPELLLENAGRFGAHESFVSTALEKASTVTGTPPQVHSPLTAREMTLLRDLPSLLTVKEIAALRSVSPNTVKTQLRSIFEKLGVSSRRDAVSAARRLGLL